MAMFYSVVDGDTLFIGADTLAMLNQIDSTTMDHRELSGLPRCALFKSDAGENRFRLGPW